ncbi:MAG: hypothetical protein J6R30_04620 [Bacteroidales bacterium]|nr:hypothetical protein [Bacteroidales bacterium]
MIRRVHSYVIAAAIWGIPGINIAVKGIRTYMLMRPDDLWWLLLITVAVTIFFFTIFRRVVRKYSERIASLPDRVMIWRIFPPKGWILLAIMMGFGITLKHIPDVPMSFTASFYSGLGPMLIVSSIQYLKACFKTL